MSKELLNIKCRTCLNITKGLKSLVTKTSGNKCYGELLEEITKISIMDHKYQELPQFICGYCVKRLKSAHAFVQQAKDVNEKLLYMLKERDNLKEELDCLQETQIDIEICLKVKKEEYDEELKNDKLECIPKLEANTAESLQDNYLTNCMQQQSLETLTKLSYIKQTEAQSDLEDLKSVKEHVTDVLEDKRQIGGPVNSSRLIETTKTKSDTDLEETDQSDNDVESLSQNDTQNCNESADATILEKQAKVKSKKITSQNSQNGIDVAVPCNKCNKIFLNSKALRVHQRISHVPEERKCTCNLCGNKFTRYCNMYKHMRTFHGPDSVTLMRKPAKGDNLYECDKCPKKYSRKKGLAYHIKTKHIISEEKQDNNNSRNSSNETKEKVIDKGSLCPICGSSFSSKNQLTVHIRRHTGERPFKCDLCERAFLLVTQLNSHKRVHTGEKPYKCQLCAKAFRVSDHLRQHMRSHTDERPFKCSQCERSFKYSQDLSKHLRANRAESSYGRGCNHNLLRCSKAWPVDYLKMDITENAMHQDV